MVVQSERLVRQAALAHAHFRERRAARPRALVCVAGVCALSARECAPTSPTSCLINVCSVIDKLAIRARSRLSMETSPYAHVAAGHDISRPFTMKTPPSSATAARAFPHPPLTSLTLRGASMQQVRAKVLSLRDSQLNMDVIEKRVSGNERVHNCWAAGRPGVTQLLLPGDPGLVRLPPVPLTERLTPPPH
ncbi:unnamed protein product [Arctia plantaginis]|uniref:Uncharacterized protein n=1 Tax=Arctia plantaginis TaxID=874455 RepID=A0A8S1ALC2_ARCPL|nr:unnamed protein product [Arctia plantaginis]